MKMDGKDGKDDGRTLALGCEHTSKVVESIYGTMKAMKACVWQCRAMNSMGNGVSGIHG